MRKLNIIISNFWAIYNKKTQLFNKFKAQKFAVQLAFGQLNWKSTNKDL